MKLKILAPLTILAFVLAACGAAPETVEQPAVVVEQESAPATEENAPVESAPAENAEAQEAAQYPAWYSKQLTDVNTGAVFTVEQNLGKVILVEMMAVW